MKSLSIRKMLYIVVMFSLLAALVPLQTANAQTNTLTFPTTGDAHVIKTEPKTNFGTKTYLTLDAIPMTRTYINFRVSGLNGAKVTSAKLRLYSLYAGERFSVARASKAITENVLTFNSAPSYGSVIAKMGAFEANKWIELNVLGVVKGEGNFTFVVYTGTGNAFSFASRERDGGAYAPQLVVTTGTAAPTAVPTKAPTAVPTKAPTAVPTKAPTAVPTKAPTAAPTNPPSSGPKPYNVPGSWSLKFSDDFNGSSLDLNKWEPNWLAGNDTAITKPINGRELSCYDPKQVSVADGSLKLTAVQRNCTANNGTTYKYASGAVTSRPHYTFNYGYMEARVWMDGSSTIKNWPAFWADGTGQWPTTGEIDVFEGLGGKASWHYHWGTVSSPQSTGGYPNIGTPTGWHIFGADWEPGVIKFYYDGAHVGTVSSNVVNSNMFLILNLGISESIAPPAQVPSNFLVDYVRVWQKS